MTREVMRKFAPQLLVVAFSDVEAAHFGSYALHLSGIRTADRLAYQLWQEVETNPDYRGKTTMVILLNLDEIRMGQHEWFFRSPGQHRFNQRYVDDGHGSGDR